MKHKLEELGEVYRVIELIDDQIVDAVEDELKEITTDDNWDEYGMIDEYSDVAFSLFDCLRHEV